MVTVLLVDDHPSLRAGVRRSLDEADGLRVVAEASDGREALRLARELRPDVVVLDIDMPGLSGIEVARELVGGHSKVLAFTGHAGRGFVRGLLDAGASGYVTKDKPEATLIEAIHGVAAGEGRWLVLPHDVHDPLDSLTERERDVLQLLARGLSNDAIAETLLLSSGTVRNALTVVYQKLEVASSREAVAWAWEHGIAQERA